MSYGSIPVPQEREFDEYVIGIQNSAQLISSLAFMLRERNYVALYDTSVLSSPESHIKNSNFSDLNRDFLYKWFLFYTGLSYNINSYENLIVIPEVAEEMSNLISAALSSIEKKRNIYRGLSANEKKDYQNTCEQLLKNSDILLELQKKMNTFKIKNSNLSPVIFDRFLQLIKLLDEHLELKKVSSRETNDTDERVAARTFYEIICHHRNVAAYTRDDDIRKLVSATFKFLLSKDVAEMSVPFLKKLSHLNIIVLKYNYDKKVFSRFFESSTLPNIGEFRFPKKVSKNRIASILEEANDILHQIQNEINKEHKPKQSTKEEKVSSSRNRAENATKKIFEYIRAEKNQKGLGLSVLSELQSITNFFEQEDLSLQIREQIKTYESQYLETIVDELQQKQEEYQQKFESLSKESARNWKEITEVASQIEVNIQKLNFYQSAINIKIGKVDEEDYLKYQTYRNKLSEHGFQVSQQTIPIPQGKLSEIIDLPIARTIQIIEKKRIEYQRTHVYLNQDNLLYFLFPSRI